MKLKEICEKTGITKRNIHFYIKEGILSPAVNPNNGYYEFTELDYKRLIFVKEMRNAGLSLSNIRSLIYSPITAHHYLNQYVKHLKQEQRHIEQTLVSLNQILDGLPLYPDFPALYNLCLESGIPEKPKETPAEDVIDYHNITVLNQYLWAGFLPQTSFTDYQEFLWLKLNRITLEHPTEEYKKLCSYFCKLPSSQFDQLFSQQSERYSYIASLKPEEYERCSQEMISALEKGLKNPLNTRFWNQYYQDFFYPTVMIHASSLGEIVREISPFYRQYAKNIGDVCEKTFTYLLSDKGKPLYEKLKQAYGEHLEIEAGNHGILEGLVNLPDMCSLMLVSP